MWTGRPLVGRWCGGQGWGPVCCLVLVVVVALLLPGTHAFKGNRMVPREQGLRTAYTTMAPVSQEPTHAETAMAPVSQDPTHAGDAKGAMTTAGTSYFEVSSVLYKEALTCLLSGVTMKVLTPVTCGALCSFNRNCHLYCLKGDMCLLFSARINKRWMGHNMNTLSYDRCFTDWHHSDDITSFIKRSEASVETSKFLEVNRDMALRRGFYCEDDSSCTKVDIQREPCWVGHFKSTVRVQAVHLVPQKDNELNLQNVVVLVGNDEKIRTNKPLASFSGVPTAGSLVKLEGKNGPLDGTMVVLILKGVKATLSFCGIMVIGEPLP